MDSYQDLAAFVATQTAVIPGLLGFSAAARQSLKTYIAAQAVEAPPKVSDDDLKRLRRCRRLFSVVFLASVFGTEVWLLSQGNETVIDHFFRYLFATVYQMALMGTLVDMTQSLKWAAFRSPGNFLHFRPAAGTVSFPRVLMAFALATGINLAAYFNVHSAFASFLSVALLYRTLSQAHRRTFSVRVMMIILLAWLALTFLLSGIMIYLAATYWMDGAAGSAILEGEGSDDVSFASPVVMRYVNLMMPFLWSLGPGLLITGCYRFDYANHLVKNPEAMSAVTLETCEPRKRFAKYLSQGVVLPSSVPESFDKPYYQTALRAWFGAQVAIVLAFASSLPLPKDVVECGAFDLMALTLAIPGMVLALALTASARGEFRRLWTYKEVWSRREDDNGGAIALGEGDHSDGVDVEEQAPAYETAQGEKQALLEPAAVEAAPAYTEVAVVDSKQ
ncbi:uncharacterized protein JCM10292_003655 [Rhodotorula paludigena]|uniref:uncharacterized protein n=1 Tax=Rhodotorula paludigena TaxID=86838 RepID=UPI00318214CD